MNETTYKHIINESPELLEPIASSVYRKIMWRKDMTRKSSSISWKDILMTGFISCERVNTVQKLQKIS